MATTITFHHAQNNAGNQKHNRREPDIYKTQKHIDPKGEHETWIDIPANQAFQKLFDESVKEFNDKQIKNNHPDRVKTNYYQEIVHSNKQHPFYEFTYQVGSLKYPFEHPGQEKIVLKEFLKQFQKENPNMYVTGAYYHADEKGVPHVHLDIIPIAHSKNGRGMPMYTGIKQALKEQGITGPPHLLQAKFAMMQQRKLEDVAKELFPDIEVIHPDIGKGSQHAENQAYQITQDAKRVAANIKSTAQVEASALRESELERIPEYQQLKEENKSFKKDLSIYEFFVSPDAFNDYERRAYLAAEIEDLYYKDKKAKNYTLSNGETLNRNEMSNLYQEIVETNNLPRPDNTMIKDLSEPERVRHHEMVR